MKIAVLEELAGTWEMIAAMDTGARPGHAETLRECADTLRTLLSSSKTDRETELEELLRSACAIADRKGAATAWGRFAASIHAVGLNGITARTYRVLPSDEQ